LVRDTQKAGKCHAKYKILKDLHENNNFHSFFITKMEVFENGDQFKTLSHENGHFWAVLLKFSETGDWIMVVEWKLMEWTRVESLGKGNQLKDGKPQRLLILSYFIANLWNKW
jgi:hypothetical protein